MPNKSSIMLKSTPRNIHRWDDKHPLNALAFGIHLDNDKWWRDPVTGKRIKRNKAEMIALMHSELSEALEGIRKSSMDAHVPAYLNEHVELADLFIRLMDYIGATGIDFDAIVAAKRLYNRTRKDHTLAARRKRGGKTI